jgi:outer membrane autotransporter protein
LTINGSSTIDSEISGVQSGYGNVIISGQGADLGAIGYLSGSDDYGVNSVNLQANSVATFNDNINAATSVTFSGEAIFTADSTITTPTFTVNSGATLRLLAAAGQESASLAVYGAAIISANTTLKLELSGTFAAGDEITLISATESSTLLTISDALIKIKVGGSFVNNTYGGNSFSTRVDGNNLILFAADAQEEVAQAPAFQDRENQLVYNVITNVDNPSGELETVQDYLTNQNNSVAQKEEVIKSLTAAIDRGTNTVIANNNITLLNLNSARLSDSSTATTIVESSFVNNLFGRRDRIKTLEPLRDNNIKTAAPLAMAFNDDSAFSKAMWIQTFGSNVDQKDMSSGEGYKSNSGGIAIGADTKLNKNFTIGLSSSYSQARVKSNAGNKSTEIDTYQFSLYSGYNAKSFFLNSSIGLSLNEYDSTRSIAITGSVAKANYSGRSYFARIELGKNFELQDDFTITPTLALTGAHNRIDSYQENGAGTLNLAVKNDSTNLFEARAGLEFAKLFITAKKTKIRPQISLSYGYDFIGDEQKATSNFVGQTSSFDSTSANIAQGSFKLGTGVGFYTKNDLTFSANYGLEKRIDYTAHSGWLRVRFGF